MRDPEAKFRMIDVGGKRITRRRAVATGTITVGPVVFQAIAEGTLPKGDPLALAEIAGVLGAKRTPDLLPLCNPLPLDQVTVHCELLPPDRVQVFCQAVAHARTGVEMEAIVGTQAALATVWDLSKGTEPNLTIGEVRLLLKEGGKGGTWISPGGIPAWLAAQLADPAPLAGITAAIVVASDRAARSERADASGAALHGLLAEAGAVVGAPIVVADERDAIAAALTGSDARLIVVTGGTGAGPRDVTPEVLHQIADRMLDGLGERMRAESGQITERAFLSRATAAVRGQTLILALPGSPKAVRECWEIIGSLVPHTLSVIAGGGHG